MSRKPYPTDLTDAQWKILARSVPEPKPGGRPAKYSRREIVNAILYLTRNGCAWRNLPHDLPPYRIEFHDFRLWQADGTWETLHAALRTKVRLAVGKTPKPSAAVLDSQTGKTTEQGGPRGYDAGKKRSAASGTPWLIRWAGVGTGRHPRQRAGSGRRQAGPDTVPGAGEIPQGDLG